MSISSNLIISSCLSVDTFALGYSKKSKSIDTFVNAIIVAIIQSFVFFLGYSIGDHTYQYIKGIDHWIILFSLLYFGIRTILDTEEPVIKSKKSAIISFFILSLVVSLDALAVGFSLINIFSIDRKFMMILFLISFLSYIIGKKTSNLKFMKNFKYAKLLSGLILIAIGVKIFIFHMMDHGFTE